MKIFKNVLCFVFLSVLLSACESEIEKVSTEIDTGTAPSNATTRWATGDKVGIYIKHGGVTEGPEALTVSSIVGNVIGFSETIPFKNGWELHTFYAYHPYNAGNVTTDPTKVTAAPVAANQTQSGATTAHISDYEYNVSNPVEAYQGDRTEFHFYSAYAILQYRINANVSGITVKSVKLSAPGCGINFTSATCDITKLYGDAAFGQYANKQGVTSETILSITGGIPAPNSTTTYADAYMVASPFNASSTQLTITVTADYNGVEKTYTFTRSGINYDANVHQIDLRIEESGNVCKPKNIRILSLCDVGSLGLYTNSYTACYYGATYLPIHAKAIRRLIHDHFGPGKTVNTGTITFEKVDINCYLNKLTRSDLNKYDIIYLNNNARPNAQLAANIMDWLGANEHRVLMLAYDWKTPCLTSSIADKNVPGYLATNNIFFRNHIKGVKPHWYNGATNIAQGNYGACRSNILVPFELNDKTSYFWKDGPFKTSLSKTSNQRYWIEDLYWGCAEVTDPNVIQLVTYRDARKDTNLNQTHLKGSGDGGMILGVDPTKRIVYIGDSELFSLECVCTGIKQDARMTYADCGKNYTLNNYSKIMGNLWAWMINEVVQKN